MSDLAATATAMTKAAADFLAGLIPDQRSKATLSFADERERRRWFYTPTPRPGLPLQEMTPVQTQGVRRLLASGLSRAGYNYAATIIGLEYLVDYTQGFPDRTYGDLPGTRVRDPLNYCVAVFGTPGDPTGWSWRIGGHHLSLHFTLRDGAISPTPAFYGAEPARSPMPGGLLLRPLAAEEDLARELLWLLRPDQLARAVISPVAPTDIVQTNRPRVTDGSLPPEAAAGPGGPQLRAELGLTPELYEMLRYTIEPKGLPASDMDDAQRVTLLRLVRVYLEHMAEPIADQYEPLLEPERFDAAAFAWAGSLEPGAPHYYRIQGERLLIEYACTQNRANHTHTVWRDPLGDFGEDILAQHYASEHAQ